MLATPIGNLADLTLRAVHLLGLVDSVACEDTRVSGQLLRHLGLDKPLLALHQHNEAAAAQSVIARLAQGQRVAYVSDAGTPAISDPGALLVAAVVAAGHRVMPIPGVSSALQAAAAAPSCQVLFEAPHRIEALVAGLAEAAPERRITLCRELTKQFETIVTHQASELPAWLAADANRGRGEFVLVLHACKLEAAADGELPAEAVKYIRRIEELVEAPVVLLSTSPERDDTIMVRDPFEG